MEKIIAYTDGACSGNPGPGGWAFLIVKNNEVVYKEANPNESKQTTNNKMEMLSVINCLEYLIKKHKDSFTVVIHSDSNNTIQTMKDWVHGWKKNGWTRPKNQEIKNLDLVKKLYTLCYESNINVEWVKVKAHQKKGSKDYDPFNDLVDKLATGTINLS